MKLIIRIGADVLWRGLTDHEAKELAACLLCELTDRGDGWQGYEGQFAIVSNYDLLDDARQCVTKIMPCTCVHPAQDKEATNGR